MNEFSIFNFHFSIRKTILLLVLLFLPVFGLHAYQVQSISEQLIKLEQTPTTKEAQKMEQLIEPYKKQLDSTMNVVIGYAPERLEGGNPESTLSNYFTDALLSYSTQTLGKKADLAILNMGGFRKPIEAGNITVRDIFELMPFENEAVQIELSGKDLQDLFNIFAQKNGEAIAGVRFSIKDGKAADIKIQGSPLDVNKTYQVVTSDYLLGGNDGMTPLRNYKNPVLLNKKLRDVFIEYIKQETAGGKQIKSEKDGRISSNLSTQSNY